MKRIYLYLVILVWCLSGISLAESVVRLDELVYSRSEEITVNEEELLYVHFIDVGGGDAILIDTPSDKKILIDGGWNYKDRGKADEEYYAYIDYFLKDDVVDLIIITHPDYDHFSGLFHILDNYHVRQIWYTGYDSQELSTTWNNLIKKIRDTEDLLFVSPIENYIGSGSVIRFDNSDTYKASDDVLLTIINSQRWIGNIAYGSEERHIDENEQRNSSSLVVRMDYGNNSFLFTGDTNGRKKKSDENECDDQELFMFRNNKNPDNPLYGKLDCTVLKVAHHGSDGTSSLPFLKSVKPEWAVISAGVHHKHPDNTVIQRLKHQDVGLDDKHILRTDQGEDNEKLATRDNLGDDCYQFVVDPLGILRIEKWNVSED